MYLTQLKNRYILYDDMGRVIISTRDKRIIKSTVERIHNGRLADDTRGEKPEVRKDTKRNRKQKKEGDEVSKQGTTKHLKEKPQ